MSITLNLFGEPALKPTESQWFTPPWICKRMVSWVPRGARILEPSCGSGNVLEALLRAGHKPGNIVAYERDLGWAEAAARRLPELPRIFAGDFLSPPVFNADDFDVVIGNFPFEGNAHMHFTVRALELAPVVIAVFPSSFEFGRERDRSLWSCKGAVKRRARLPERVDYGGDQSPSFDSVVLRIERRTSTRGHGDTQLVTEEVWLP